MELNEEDFKRIFGGPLLDPPDNDDDIYERARQEELD